MKIIGRPALVAPISRQLYREAAGLQHPALHILDPRLEMGVAGVGVGPGVEDRDHRLAGPFLRREAHLHGAGSVAEGAQVVGREPAGAAEGVGRLAGRVGHDDSLPSEGSVAAEWTRVVATLMH
jgi:hypothetical protein